MNKLKLYDINSGYGEVQILWGVNLALEEGKLTSLVGGNGVGKTTLLRTVMGTVRPSSGTIEFNGDMITRLPPYRKAELGLILVPEGRQLFTDMTVHENLEMGSTPGRAQPHLERNLARVFKIFPRLKEREAQKAGTLSGGEQQMLAVARGLMAEPEVLMIDELSLGLAPVLVLDLFEILQELKNEGLTMLLVEQNVHMALTISDYVYVLSEGRVTLEGTPEEVAQNPEVQKSYLGI
jgi:branched-chain amino acid transport system ATP-binding protein